MSNSIVFKIENDKGEMKQWEHVSIPVKYGKLLDEQLDHATVDLLRIKKKEFKLFSKASIVITDASGKEVTENYLIANDNAFETPVGSGIYNHTLTLIELTKYLECFPLENLCFTNPRGQNIDKTATPDLYINGVSDNPIYSNIENFSDYKSPVIIGSKLTLKSLINEEEGHAKYGAVGKVTITNANDVSNPYTVGISETGKIGTVNSTGELVEENNIVYLKAGVNNIKYTYRITQYNLDKEESFDIVALPAFLKNWTVNEVIQRILQVVEPLREGESPRFLFDPTGKEKLFNQVAPEFTFTGQNLREALQTVGGFIHAEPRLTENNKIVFDFYGENEYATYTNYTTKNVKRLSAYKYRTYQGAHSIEQACNTLDSYMQNLVNRIDSENAVVGQPYKNGGGQTLRVESNYVRASEDDSTFFPTNYPIDDIKKFEVLYDGKWYDITAFIYEENVYRWLSSYITSYPSSKSYALHYTLGGKGIKGLFFKPANPLDSSFENYSIVNIISKVTGKNIGKIDYPTLQFRLAYTPIYNTRVRQSKQNVTDWLRIPRTINYAQTDNSVETRYYGEHIKGAVERLGTIEKTVVMNMRHINNIPKAGQLWDDDFYISSVFVEVQQDLFIVSCGLSKNFNRISKYIGANSQKRVYEISEKMVQQRHSVYTDYLVFTTPEITHSAPDNVYLSATGLRTLFDFSENKEDKTVTSVLLQGESDTIKQNLNKILLPVITSAFGNAIEFTWEYQDNYSAGTQSIKVDDGDNDITGYFAQAVEYGDYYGRISKQKFALIDSGGLMYLSDVDFSTVILPYTFPLINTVSWVSEYVAGTGEKPIIKRKDGREALKETYSIELVTDRSDFVISSAMASRNPLVYYHKNKPKAQLYILPNRINKFANVIDLPDNGHSVDWIVDGNKKMVTCNGEQASSSGKAWCYAIPTYYGEPYKVMNDNGEVEEVTPVLGGELLFGQNIEIKEGDTIGAFTSYLVHDVYKYLKTKEIDKTTKVIFINKDIYGNDTEIEITTGKDGIVASDMFPDVPDLKGQEFIGWVYYDKNENAQYLYGGEDVYSIAKNKVLTVYSLWEEITGTPGFEFVIEDGIILGTNGEFEGETLTIEEGAIISDYALSAGNMSAPDLRSVIINCPPIYTIGENIFDGQHIETIRIEGTQFSIMSNSFDGLTNLTAVYIEDIDKYRFIEKIGSDEFASGSRYTVYVHCSNGYLIFENGKLQKTN